MVLKLNQLKFFVFCAAAAVFLPFLALADNYGDKALFSVDKNYDADKRSTVNATLAWSGQKIYFYADDAWWNGLDSPSRQNYNTVFQNLDKEFAGHIYPKLVELFGTDVNPVVDRGGKITVLIHPMVKDAGGYITTADGYSKYQVPSSNEREMVYFNARFIDSPLAKAYLAHEFTHLITFNQKDRLRNVSDDVWLNEARADYSSTILGYDTPFAQSNFDQRVKSFVAQPLASLVEWENKTANYGATHLFMQYLVDQYGIEVIANSMKTEQTGVASIEYALRKNGFEKKFAQVFGDWLVALAANDCRLGDRYCYKFGDLKNFTVAPKINYLPGSEQVSMSVMYNTAYFAGNWQKITGANGDLRLDFSSEFPDKFLVPYILCDKNNACQVGSLDTAADGKAMLGIADFGRQYISLTVLPFASGKTFGFGDDGESKVSYTLNISVKPKTATDSSQNVIVGNDQEEEKIAAMMAQIEALKKEIERIKALLAARIQSAVANRSSKFSCAAIVADLYYGVQNHDQVVCLQEFLKSQGGLIYPGGVISGKFFAQTQEAVIRFQEKYADEILTPLGLKNGTGYVGQSTRAKINKLIFNS